MEKGYQIGVSRTINYQKKLVYTYAIQKIQGKYLVYTDKYDLNHFYAEEMEDTERTVIYDSFSQFMENFQNKHGIRFEDFYVSKGQKFFNPECYLN